MYTNLFEDRKYVESAYEVTLDENIVILLAHYECENYKGYSYVLFYDKSNGKLYEVTGSHCSCYGLEGQWEPEETSIEILRAQIERGAFYGNIREEVSKILDQLSYGLLV